MENKKYIIEDNSLEKKEVKKSPLVSSLIPIIIISALVGAVFGFAGAYSFGLINLKNGKISLKGDSKEISREKIVEEDSVITSMIEKSSPSVVSIVITKDVPKFRSFFNNPFEGFDSFEFFSNPFQNQSESETERQKVGGGSGFFVSSSGMIVTNKHVVEDSSAQYTVIANDGKEYEAKVMAIDPTRDIAIIKVEGSDFPVLELGDSNSLKIGQTVVAIGNSLGEFTNTVSKGIISGLKRDVTAGSGFGQTEQLSNIIQTDAAINPGNSGGPLLDVNGKVVGINVAMAQGAENIGFAIPIDQAKKAIEQVTTKGKISSPFLGVRTLAINKQVKQEANLDFDYGALVLRGETITDFAVIPGSPADKAGITENDIILEVNGEKVDSKNLLGNLIAKYDVGDEITLKIWHKGDKKDVKVILEERK